MSLTDKQDSNPNDNSSRNATKKESKAKDKKKGNKKTRTSVIEICNNEEKISNSSTPIENEKLQRETQEIQNKDKIELDFEITEEQKKQEQSMQFGATPISEISQDDEGVSNVK